MPTTRLVHIRKISIRLFQSTLALLVLFTAGPALADEYNFAGLSGTVTMYEDARGIPTIVGNSEEDVAFVQGYIHARDRFFQMDYFRKLGSGRLAELVGPQALPTDIQFRTFGLRRAALASWKIMDPRTKSMLQAYANGVNTWLNTNPLPPEYVGLELSHAAPWSPLDSLTYAKLLSFQLSFDLDIDATIDVGTYQAVGDFVGFDGTALYFEDVFRSQPRDGRVTIPGFLSSIGGIGGVGQSASESGGRNPSKGQNNVNEEFGRISDTTVELAVQAREKFAASEFLKDALKPLERVKGSNEWAVSGEHTASGYPLIANDPHLALNTPSTFYENNLVYQLGEDSYSVSGVVFTGAPGVILGCNNWICWGATVHPMDVTDVFQDQALLLPLPGGGLPTHTVHNGVAEPVKIILQSYFVNSIGDGQVDSVARANLSLLQSFTLVVPRRNNGPILAVDGDSVLTLQYTGFAATQEIRFFQEVDRARNLDEFRSALQYFDVGSQNWIYADVEGNIGYFTSAENPIRSDLAAGAPDGGIPPWFIRDGTGALNHEWAPVSNPQPGQAIPFEILPANEMPHLVNPASGYIANANNDPIGVTLDNNPLNQLRPADPPGSKGIYYLNNGYADYRMGRVDRVLQSLIGSGVPVTMQDMTDLQGNVQLLDAELILPILLDQFTGLELPPGAPMAQALDVLSTWDYSAHTGLAEGWDAGDDAVVAEEPGNDEVRNSVAATVYSVWRSMLVRNTIDATLSAIGLGNNLPGSTVAERAFNYHLTNYDTNGGVGASGINFFSQGLAPTVIGSLQQALDLLASDEFAPAFGNSIDVMDYRWGKLHRIVFDHPLNMDFLNIPNAGGFSDLAADLPGLARQGGYQVVDASSHSARADSLNGFMFGSGPSRRFVGEMTPSGPDAYEVIPGGQSGVFLSPNYGSQLPLWLTNSYHPLYLGEADGAATAVRSDTFSPAE
jgi:penicillin amidase